MKRQPIFFFVGGVIPLSLGALIGCSQKGGFEMNPNPIGQKITYRYVPMGAKQEAEEYCYYTDDYFKAPSTDYNPSLATTSLSMVEVAFPAARGGLKDYSHKYVNFEAFSKSAGFEKLHYNEDFVTIPMQNSIGLIMASKKIDDFTLIMVGIRGNDYGAEWAGNFFMGENGNHAGFELAANATLDEIKYYIEENEIEGKLKLWMGGFSRSSAVCNLAAGFLDESIIENKNILSDKVTYEKEGIYAFCFEPPQGASVFSIYDIQGIRFNNIYCFTNFHDLVPRVAPTDFGFKRYGRQYYFPCSLFDPINYQQYVEAMKFLYNRSQANNISGSYIVDGFDAMTIDFSKTNSPVHEDENKINWQQGLFYNDFLESLATIGIPSRKIFNDSYQEGLMELFKLINDTTSEESRVFTKSLTNVVLELTNYNLLSVIIDDFFNDQDMLPQDIIPFFLRAYQKYGIVTTAEQLGGMIGNLISALARVILANKEDFASLLDVGNIERVLNAHSYDVALAWLRTMDPNYLKTPIDYSFGGSFNKFTVTEKMNIKIYDDKHNLLGEFKNGVPKFVGNSKFTYGIEDELMTIYLPSNATYGIVLTTNETKQAKYTRYAFDLSQGVFEYKKASLITVNKDEELIINIIPSN